MIWRGHFFRFRLAGGAAARADCVNRYRLSKVAQPSRLLESAVWPGDHQNAHHRHRDVRGGPQLYTRLSANIIGKRGGERLSRNDLSPIVGGRPCGLKTGICGIRFAGWPGRQRFHRVGSCDCVGMAGVAGRRQATIGQARIC